MINISSAAGAFDSNSPQHSTAYKCFLTFDIWRCMQTVPEEHLFEHSVGRTDVWGPAGVEAM